MIDFYGIEDVIWQIVRIAILCLILWLTEEILGRHSHWCFTILIGFYIYHMLMKMINIILYHLCGLEALGSYDYIFLLDDNKNISNIVGCIFFEEFDFDEMKHWILSKSADLHKCRSKLVKRYGVWWYQKMSAEESIKKIPTKIVLREDIHTDEDLQKMMLYEETTRDEMNNIQLKFILCPKFRNGMGTITLKTHHCFTDGLGFGTMFLCL